MKRIFLTGASSGIGLTLARSLITQGHEVWGTSRDPKRIPEMPGLHPLRLQLTDAHSIEEAFNRATAEAGHIDVQPGDICTEFNEVVSKSAKSDPRYERKVAKTWQAVERNMRAAPKPDL